MTDEPHTVPAGLPAQPSPPSTAAVLAGRLARARWVAFLVAILGLVALGLGLTASAYLFGGDAGASWWQHPVIHGLPMVGTLLALFASTTFAAMSLAARVGAGRSICGHDDDRPFPSLPRLTAGRLSRLGTGAALAALALGAAAVTAVGAVMVGGFSSVPGIEWMPWRASFTWGIRAVTMTWSLPLLTGLSLAGLALGASLGRTGGAPALPPGGAPRPSLPPAAGEEDATASWEVAETSDAAAGVCPVCGCTVDVDPVTCERCGTAHHRDCFDYAGGCAIFGCDRSRWASRNAPTTTEALAPVKAALEGWARLYRGHWYALTASVAGVTAVAWASALPIGGGSAGDLVDAAQAMGGLLALGGFAACVAGIGVYAVLLALEAWRRRNLAALVDLPDRPPATESRQVVDRLDGSNPGESLASLLTLLAFGSVMVTLFVPALHEAFPGRWYTAFDSLERVLIPLLGVLFPLLLARAARRRLAYMQSLQNRLAATLKKGADFSD